jgi:hypothetical protein
MDLNDSAMICFSTYQPTPNGDDYRTDIFFVELK